MCFNIALFLKKLLYTGWQKTSKLVLSMVIMYTKAIIIIRQQQLEINFLWQYYLTADLMDHKVRKQQITVTFLYFLKNVLQQGHVHKKYILIMKHLMVKHSWLAKTMKVSPSNYYFYHLWYCIAYIRIIIIKCYCSYLSFIPFAEMSVVITCTVSTNDDGLLRTSTGRTTPMLSSTLVG